MTGRRLAAAALAVAFCTAGIARATDVHELVQETQRVSQESSHITLVWWIPQEFWEASMAANPNVTPEARADVLKALADLQIVALLRGKTSLAGLTEVPSREEMLANARFELNGKVLEPLDGEKVGVGAQAILSSIKPVLSGMLGQFGQGLQMVVYPSKQDNQRLIDPRKPGSFQYTLFGQTFQWRMPLASLLPKKVDPKTREEFPGNYDFNPYTGGKLSTK
jgi:hypothetical protein